ncbi:hypothetical protein AAVH_04165 [Aphelenchoides avenae]|nr:hypothetical protein AAVH_04165 [Aphelenchus avenae]
MKATVENLTGTFKAGGMTPPEQIGDSIGAMGSRAGKTPWGEKMKVLQVMHADVGKTERRSREEVNKAFCELVCSSYLKGHCKQLEDVIKDLKKRRVDKDACNSEYNSKQTEERQKRVEAADQAFDTSLAQAQAAFSKLDEYQQTHANGVKALCEQLSAHHQKCQAIIDEALTKLA